jgi:hypothetical protein
MSGTPPQQPRKRKIGRCNDGPAPSSNPTPAGAPPAADVDALVKRLRTLEAENAQLKHRVAASESTVQHLAEHLTSSSAAARLPAPAAVQVPPRVHRQVAVTHPLVAARLPAAATPTPAGTAATPAPLPSFPAGFADNATGGGLKPARLHFPGMQEPEVQLLPSPSPASPPTPTTSGGACDADTRGTVVRQRINSPQQFYLTLLAMYCSAFAHIMHGPNSAHPILSLADQQRERERREFSKLAHQQPQPLASSSSSSLPFSFSSSSSLPTTGSTSTSSSSADDQLHYGTAPAGADVMTGLKYERMLRASSLGLLRLIQFRRKVVRDRAQRTRRLGGMGGGAAASCSKFDEGDDDARPSWE